MSTLLLLTSKGRTRRSLNMYVSLSFLFRRQHELMTADRLAARVEQGSYQSRRRLLRLAFQSPANLTFSQE